jgi:hypothetical protein
MLWAGSTRHALLRSRVWSVIHLYAERNLHQLRQLVTTRGARRRYYPRWYDPRCATTWLDLGPTGASHGIPPDSVPDDGRVSVQESPIRPVNNIMLIDRVGKLKLDSTTSSEKGESAVLVVSAASKHLTKSDFTRLLAAEDRAEPGGITGTLISV